jgi:hypothetical protein
LTGQGLVLGAGNLLAKLNNAALPIEADQKRIWTLLAVAYDEKISQAVLGSLRRAAKRCQGGDKSLAAIHLAQMGWSKVDKVGSIHIIYAYNHVGTN